MILLHVLLIQLSLDESYFFGDAGDGSYINNVTTLALVDLLVAVEKVAIFYGETK